MRKEIIAFFLLVSLFVGSVISVNHLERITDEMCGYVSLVDRLATSGDWEEADRKMEETIKIWEEHSDFTHIMLRHSEVELVADSLFELAKCVKNQETGAAAGAAQMARYHLISISRIEEIRPGSVF